MTAELAPEKKALLKIVDDVILRGHGEVLLKIRDGKLQFADEIIKHKF